MWPVLTNVLYKHKSEVNLIVKCYHDLITIKLVF